MKKLIISLFTTLLMLTPAMASGNIDVLPTMQSKTNVQDRVWVGTFQIVWNDFMDKIAFTQIKFPGGTPVIVNELNKQDFTVDQLNEKCYYKYVGKIKKNTKKVIAKAIKRKFKETSDLLDQLVHVGTWRRNSLVPVHRLFFIHRTIQTTSRLLQLFSATDFIISGNFSNNWLRWSANSSIIPCESCMSTGCCLEGRYSTKHV